LSGQACLAAGGVVVGDIGQLREDGEATDQQARLVQAQGVQHVLQLGIGLAVAMLAHRPLADVLDQVEDRLALLLADHVAEEAAQKAHPAAAVAEGGLEGGHGGLALSVG